MSTRDLAQAPADGDAVRLADCVRRKPEDPLLLERLAETGFLATEFGLDQEAERIFSCLSRLKPGKPSPLIALAMVEARRGHMDSAIGQLRKLIEQHPESELARAVLGTMLIHVGASGARELLDDIVAHGSDSGAISVAESCIEQARVQEAAVAGEGQSALEFHRHHNIRA